MQDPIKLRELQITENAKKASTEMYPMLYCLVATTDTGRVTLYNEIHYTKDEAINAFEKAVPEVTGLPANQWRIKMVAILSADILEEKFKQYADKVQLEKKRDKNELMKEILEKKDLDLLHRNYARFTKEEILYLHSKMTGANPEALGVHV